MCLQLRNGFLKFFNWGFKKKLLKNEKLFFFNLKINFQIQVKSWNWFFPFRKAILKFQQQQRKSNTTQIDFYLLMRSNQFHKTISFNIFHIQLWIPPPIQLCLDQNEYCVYILTVRFGLPKCKWKTKQTISSINDDAAISV